MNKNMRKMYTEEEIGKLGGTKLYKHLISVAGSSSIIVISASSIKAVDIDTLDIVLSKATSSFCFVDGPSNYWAIIDIKGSIINMMTIDNNSNNLVKDESFDYTENTITDTVTEL